MWDHKVVMQEITCTPSSPREHIQKARTVVRHMAEDLLTVPVSYRVKLREFMGDETYRKAIRGEFSHQQERANLFAKYLYWRRVRIREQREEAARMDAWRRMKYGDEAANVLRIASQ